MAFGNGPRIVTDGLVLSLDAADRNSYPGSGTTWFDMSGNNYHFTLDSTNISWNSSGYFSLSNGGATYNGGITTSSINTLVFWIKSTDLISLFWEGQTSAHYVGAYRVENKEYYSNTGTPNFYMDTIEYANIYDYFPDGLWHMVEFKNTNIGSWTSSKFNKYSGYTFENSDCASIIVYNRNLTQEESIQNYNAQKSRFGL